MPSASMYTIEASTLTAIADGIRSFYELDSSYLMTPSQMIDIASNKVWVAPYEYASSTITEYSNSVAKAIYNNAFENCTSLSQVSISKCTSIGNNAFQSCTSLSQVSFPKCTNIGSYTFRNCSILISLYLNGVTSVPTLANSNAFSSSPLSAGGSGMIYVPSSLVTAFKTATNWSYLSARIVGV